MQNVIGSSKLAFGAALFGVAFAANASAVFSVNTSVFQGANNKVFDSDKISGTGSTLLTLNNGGSTIDGQGFITFTTFQSPGVGTALSYNKTNLTGDPTDTSGYLLWAEYSYTTKLVSGNYGQAGSTYDIVSMTLSFWGEAADGSNSTFTRANVANGASGTVQRSADAVELGYSTMLLAGQGGASFNNQFGSSFNPTLAFELTAAGKSFFFDPNPFYNIAFGSFTNVSTGVAADNGRISINEADGGVTFAGRVPEPASLALVGIAVLGAGFAARRRKAA
jgi:hypothetical protein